MKCVKFDGMHDLLNFYSCRFAPNRLKLFITKNPFALVAAGSPRESGSPLIFNAADYLWLALGLVWLIGALTAKRTERTQSSSSRGRHLALEATAFFLVFGRIPWPAWLEWRFVSERSLAARWVGLALTAAGIGFAIAARLWIGRNWSGRVTIKEQHQLIQSGPYSLVRHPIYSGFLLALLGTAIVHGEIRGLVGVALAALGWVFKLRTEEEFLSQQFGNAYLAYKQRVKALVPFVV